MKTFFIRNDILKEHWHKKKETWNSAMSIFSVDFDVCCCHQSVSFFVVARKLLDVSLIIFFMNIFFNVLKICRWKKGTIKWEDLQIWQGSKHLLASDELKIFLWLEAEKKFRILLYFLRFEIELSNLFLTEAFLKSKPLMVLIFA